MPLNYVCRSVCLLPLLAIDDGTPPFVSSKAVDILPPGCRHPTPSPFATLVPLRINPQTLAAQSLIRLATFACTSRLLASAIAHPNFGHSPSLSPCSESFSNCGIMEFSHIRRRFFRGLGEGLDSTLHAPGDEPRLERRQQVRQVAGSRVSCHRNACRSRPG